MHSEGRFASGDLNASVVEHLQNWRSRMQQYGVPSVYTFLSAATLWPVVEAVQRGEWAAAAALGTVAGSVGANLIANHLQGWKDEADGARRRADEVNREPALRAELDAVLQNFAVFAQARQALPEADHLWFDDALRGELGRLGSTIQYTAHLTGSGAIAQGPGSVAAGAGGIAVGGHVHGSINPGPSEQKG